VPNKHSISPSMADFLLAVWDITGTGDSTRLATKEEIKARGITDQSNEFFKKDIPCIDAFEIFERDEEGNPKPGAPKVAYCLHPKVVTLPRTAKILLELLDYPRTESFLILRDSFEKFIAEKFGFDAAFISDRMDAAITADYIIVQTRGYIWPSVRIYREFEYIRLIAQKYTPLHSPAPRSP
jgi:hypothetical protein